MTIDKKLKIKLFLVSIFLFVSFLSIAPINVNAATVEANWLSIVPGDFVDYDSRSHETKLKTTVGGGGLISFQSLGVIRSETNDQQIVYKSRAVFEEEIVIHTSVGIRDTYPNMNTNNMFSVEYFRLNRFYISGATQELYHLKWYDLDLGNPTFHNYNGYLPVTLSIKPFLDTTGYINVGGVSMPAPTYTSEILQARIVDIKSGDCGKYKDEFLDIGIQDTTIEIVPMADTFTAAQEKLMDWYNDHDLGIVSESGVIKPTEQQGKIDADPVGTTYHNAIPSDSLTIELDTELEPRVYKYTQTITIKRAGITYWQWGLFAGNIDPVYGVETRVIPRTIGVHIDNYFVHYYIIVTVDFYATVPSTAKLTQTVLNDPYLQVGSWAWDTSMFGTEAAELAFTTGDLMTELMPWIILIIIIVVVIVGIYIFIQVGMPMIMVRTKAKTAMKYRAKLIEKTKF